MTQKLFLFGAAFIAAFFARADEGMWMLTDLKEQNAATMYELGLDINSNHIYCPDSLSLKDAVIHFGGGCTGEIISKNGLILTNHHCGYSYIQQHSSIEHDYLTNGFWAMNHGEELPCKDLTVTFIDQILDITFYVKNQLSKDKDPNGTNYLSPSYLGKVAQKFAKENNIETNDAVSLELKPFYGANKYYLFIKTTYPDIRMVGAPPSSIGKFGADTDNWMWPRHTGDFSLFRIYADSEGKPAGYSLTNIPLKVKKHLTINLSGIKEGDFTFTMGFPGRNWRYMISDEVEERMQTTNFMRATVRGVRQNAMMKEMQKDPAIRIQYASKYASSANYWKNAIGMNKGLIDLKVIDVKKAQEESLLAYGKEINDSSYLKAFNSIQNILKKRYKAIYHQQAILEALQLGTEFSRIPDTGSLLAALKIKNNIETDTLISDLKQKGEKYFDKNYNPIVDRNVSKEMLKLYCKLIPQNERISIFTDIDNKYKGNIDLFIDYCFEHSIFRSKESFKRFISNPTIKEIENDPMINYAKSVRLGYNNMTQTMKEETNAYNEAHKIWVKGMMELKKKKDKPIYPDANSTLRLTYGQIHSYKPADGTEYSYYTTLKGVMQKEDPDNYEFVIPAKLKELYEKKDFGNYAMSNGEMPVCFITNTDNTGGNSGSPVFNGKGELIGTAFDRNWEGLTGDIAFQPVLQRAVCVDIRYILFIIDKYAGASHLIKEMTIKQ